MKFNSIKTLLVLLVHTNFLCALTQEEINKLALQVESKMVVSGPVGEITARNFLKNEGITNTNDINSIINLAFKIKSDPKLKLELSKAYSSSGVSDDSLTISTEKINELALQLESKMKGAGGEILVRNFLKDEGVTNKKDQLAVINRIFEIQKNPKLKINRDVKEDKKPSKSPLSTLTEKEINHWALKAEPKMRGPMGEFAARKYLKEQGVTNKSDLDLIIDKIIELQKSEPQQPSESLIKPIKKLDVTTGGTSVEVPAEVEEWAKKLRSLDPATQTFKIIKQLKEGNVEKDLWASIMSRIRQLRLEKQDDDQISKDITPIEIGKEVALQKFDDLVKRRSIQEQIKFFESQKLEQFVDIYTYSMNFPVNHDGTLQLWLAVNIENKIHVLINNQNSGLDIGQNWYHEFSNMDRLKALTLDDLKKGISFSLVPVTQDGKKSVYVYVQRSDEKMLAFAKLDEIDSLPLEVTWSGSLFNPKKLKSNTSLLLTDTNNLAIDKINIPLNFSDNDFLQYIDFKIKKSLPVLWQDLVVYFALKGDVHQKTTQQRIAYDWVLRHTEDSVYKG